MAQHLPCDILIEIFLRAPIESLLRCTSICKYWYSTITHSTFTDTHLNRQKDRDLWIIRSSPDGLKEDYCWHLDDVAFTKLGLQTPPEHLYDTIYRIVDSCNGVLCLVNGPLPPLSETFVLWNPSISKLVRLPPPPITYKQDWEDVSGFGFGFDAVSNDYKVIKIIHYVHDDEVLPMVVIFNLNSGIWNNISHLADGFEKFGIRDGSQVFVNGALHWIAIDKKTHCNTALSFNMSDEVFRHINLPNGSSYFKACEIEGLLSVVEDIWGKQKHSIWVMKEYGVESSWNKYFDLDLYRFDGRILGSRKNCDVLLDVQGELQVYDPHVKGKGPPNRPKNLGSYRSSESWQRPTIHALRFVESLVLIGK